MHFPVIKNNFTCIVRLCEIKTTGNDIKEVFGHEINITVAVIHCRPGRDVHAVGKDMFSMFRLGCH